MKIRLLPVKSEDLGNFGKFLQDRFGQDRWIAQWTPDPDQEVPQWPEIFPRGFPGVFEPEVERFDELELFFRGRLPDDSSWKHTWKFRGFWGNMVQGRPFTNPESMPESDTYNLVLKDMIKEIGLLEIVLRGVHMLCLEGKIEVNPAIVPGSGSWTDVNSQQGKGGGYTGVIQDMDWTYGGDL